MKPANNVGRLYGVFVSLALIAVGIWAVRSQLRLNDLHEVSLRKKVPEEQHQVLLGKKDQEIAELRALLAAKDGESPTPKGDQFRAKLEDALFEQAENAVRLSEYLETNPRYRIPEMKYLSAGDWIAATQHIDLKSDSDYRKALAELRDIAKHIVAPAISEALRYYVEKSGGELPEDATDLHELTEGAIDLEILKRYEVNPSAELKNVVVKGAGIRGDGAVLIERSPVDELWDTQHNFSSNGGHGKFMLDDRLEAPLKEAIESYEKDHGERPEDVRQIESYLSKDQLSTPKLDAMFEALNTMPALEG